MGDVEAPNEVEIDPVWRFCIPNPEPLSRPIIAVNDASFDYNPDGKKENQYLLQKVNFGIDLTSKIGILGCNGAGKSTLINMITDKLCPLKGSISRNNSVRIGIFTQHSTDKFDLSLSSVENMLAMYPGAVDQVMRSFVGKFQIQGDEALKDFRGGLVVVSHDQYFVTNTCNELWVVGNGIADHFQESFEEYKKETLKRIAKHVDTSVKKVNQINK